MDRTLEMAEPSLAATSWPTLPSSEQGWRSGPFFGARELVRQSPSPPRGAAPATPRCCGSGCAGRRAAGGCGAARRGRAEVLLAGPAAWYSDAIISPATWRRSGDGGHEDPVTGRGLHHPFEGRAGGAHHASRMRSRGRHDAHAVPPLPEQGRAGAGRVHARDAEVHVEEEGARAHRGPADRPESQLRAGARLRGSSEERVDSPDGPWP